MNIYFLTFLALIVAAAWLPQAHSQELVIEEIVVTAQKREQSLQDVPAAVSALSGEQLDEKGWLNIGQIAHSVPSVTIGGDGEARPFLFIRGVGTRKFDMGAEGSVGVFVDEIYNTRFSTALAGIHDLERIEVLRGPQGTLYGRNTIGGAINLYTKKPSQEFEARVRAASGNEGFRSLAGYVSGGSERIAGRLSASYRDDDGVLEERISGNNDGQESTAVRLGVVATPNDLWEIDLSAQLTSLEQDARLAQPIGSPGGIILFAHPRLVATGVLPALLASEAQDARTNAADVPGGLDVESQLMAMKLTRTGQRFDFTSITSVTQDEIAESLDFDATSLDIIFTDVEQQSDQFSQEFRLTSVPGGLFTFDDRVNWVGGVYYYADEGDRTDSFMLSSDSLLAPPPPFGVSVNLAEQVLDMETTSFAVYGQATVGLTNRLNLTLGFRYSDDQKDYTYQINTNTPGVPVAVASGGFSETLNFDSFDPKVTLDYAFSDNILGYVTYSTGYKSGGVQFATFVVPAARGGFDKEELNTFEIGLKSSLANRRVQLNAAIFQYDYVDQQVQSIVDLGGGVTIGLTQNAGESDMTGVELETVALISENLSINASYAFLDAEFERFDSVAGSRAGNEMPLAPEQAYTVGVNYDLDFSNYGGLGLRAEYSWKEEFFFDSSNDPVSLQEAYGVVNLVALWQVSDQLRVRVFCNNCNDELYKTQVTTFSPWPPGTMDGRSGRASYARTRRAGIELTYDF